MKIKKENIILQFRNKNTISFEDSLRTREYMHFSDSFMIEINGNKFRFKYKGKLEPEAYNQYSYYSNIEQIASKKLANEKMISFSNVSVDYLNENLGPIIEKFESNTVDIEFDLTDGFESINEIIGNTTIKGNIEISFISNKLMGKNVFINENDCLLKIGKKNIIENSKIHLTKEFENGGIVVLDDSILRISKFRNIKSINKGEVTDSEIYESLVIENAKVNSTKIHNLKNNLIESEINNCLLKNIDYIKKSKIKNSDIDGGAIENSEISDSTLKEKNIISDSLVSKSKFLGNNKLMYSNVSDSKISDSILFESKVLNSKLNKSNISKSVVDESDVVSSNLELDSDIYNSKIQKCEMINKSRITESEVSESIIENSSITNKSQIEYSEVKNNSNSTSSKLISVFASSTLFNNSNIEAGLEANITDCKFIDSDLYSESLFEDQKIVSSNFTKVNKMKFLSTGSKFNIIESNFTNLRNTQIFFGSLNTEGANFSGNVIMYNSNNEVINVINSRIIEDSVICSNSEIKNASISGNAIVFEKTSISGLDNQDSEDDYAVRISGYTKIFGRTKIINSPKISGLVNIYGEAEIVDEPIIYGKVNILDDARVSGKSKIYKEEIINKYEERYE